jgi:hypothetical protein
MNQYNWKQSWLALIAGVLISITMIGCGGSHTPPEALSDEELPAALQDAFSGAEAGIKGNIDAGVAAFQANDYLKAITAFNQVTQNQNLSEYQRAVVSRAVISANEHIQMEGAQGNPAATQFMKYQGANK